MRRLSANRKSYPLYISENFTKQPDLDEVARYIYMSKFHFQRLFTHWVGISPKKFTQYLTVEFAKKTLQSSSSLFNAALDSGLSGSGRLHDLFMNFEAMTPGEYKSSGKNIEIAYWFYPSPFGEYLLAVTNKGICGLIFIPGNDRQSALKEMQRRWPLSHFYKSMKETKPYSEKVWAGFLRLDKGSSACFVKGTPFQIKVWQALLQIPFGTLVTYHDIAVMIGMPDSIRAVANAISSNSIAFLIPCHRVIASSGALCGYRWGMARKSALIGWEAAQANRGSCKVKTGTE